MKEKKFSDALPVQFKDCLPINIFFVREVKNMPEIRKGLTYATSHFYYTQKMRCYEFYKPAFL